MRVKLSVVFLFILVFSLAVGAQTTEFVYQGSLKDNAVPASGNYDFEFALFDAVSAGSQIGATIPKKGVAVANGIFSVKLDFGSSFPGAQRYLEIHVRQTSGGSFTPLTPRQPISNTPYAVKSLTADNATQLGGLPANTYLQKNGDGSQLTNLNGANITNNTINVSALAADTFPNSQNLSRLAQLRWDLLGQRVAVGSSPGGAAFDGANIWITNFGGNSLTKLRASDGLVLGTFMVGSGPVEVAFDGANIWVANLISSNVMKLRSDGAVLGTFAVGTSPHGLAFDGTNIWVTSVINGSVTKLRASDGALMGTFAVGTGPQGVAFDGASIWVANYSSNNVTKLRASDGALQGTITVGSNPVGVAFDGANIWVANVGGNTVK